MRRWAYTAGAQGYTAPVDPGEDYLVDFAWVGAVNDDGATVKFRSTNAGDPDLLVSTSPSLTSPSTHGATEGNDKVWTAVITGLAPDTQYYFGFDGNAMTGKFRTWAAEGDPFSFLMAASGDQGLSPQYPGVVSGMSNPPTFDRMLEHDPLFFIQLGDFHYKNPSSTDPAVHRGHIRNMLAASRVNDFVRQVPTAWTPDDHDRGPNDHNGSHVCGPAAELAYRDYVPHWPLTDAGGTWHTFVTGRTRWINLDSRHGRSPNGATDNSSKTRLGATQKDWLFDTLLAATEPLIVINVVSYIGGTSSFSDGWDSFNTERVEIFDFLEDEGLMSRILLLGADIHELMWDDGTNTNFATGAVDPGPPYVGFAPIDASFNDFSAVLTEKYRVRRQQYGTLEIVDSGSDIDVIATGYALSASPGATSSALFEHTINYPG